MLQEFTLTLKRPERGNSYDGETAREINTFLKNIPATANKLIIRAEGKNFCTGADLNWMSRGPSLSLQENINEMNDIYQMYEAFLSLTVPVVAIIQGKVRGGGLGLVAVSDYAIATEEADFFLPEKSLGLVPGIIEPILLRKVGKSGVDRLEASPVNPQEAIRMNLIQKIGSYDESLLLKRSWKKDEALLQEMKTQLSLSAEKRMSFKFSGSRK
ncbi:MAG: enoyl-CoA hydratase/isomerase family protein [Bdellovibrionota bacterium]